LHEKSFQSFLLVEHLQVLVISFSLDLARDSVVVNVLSVVLQASEPEPETDDVNAPLVTADPTFSEVSLDK
jgi:hypothetical protein